MSVTKTFTGRQHHEQDPRWSAVDAYTLSHLHPATRANHDGLAHALQNSREQGLPDISSLPTLGKFLALQCRLGKVTHALEVGTLGGYTSIWIATLNPTIRVTSIEVDPFHASVARQNVALAGVSDRVEVLLGAGLDVLPNLLNEIKAGTRPPFGMTYIDADKMNNWRYFDLAVQMSGSGAGIYVDNVVQAGRIASEEKEGSWGRRENGVRGARILIEQVGKDSRVEGVVVQTVGEKSYDGVLVAVVK